MSVFVRIRNGMMPDGEGNGGASEGDIRGNSSDLFEGEGVVDVVGGHLNVTESSVPAMNVLVDTGVGYIPNTAYDETDSDSIKFWEAVVSGVNGERTLSIDSNSSGQTRYDLVCLKIDPGASPDYYASDVAELIIVKGTPGAGVPATPAYHLALAEVTVVNGATEIEDDDINDVRVQVKIRRATVPEKRITSITSSSTPTPNMNPLTGTDTYEITALAADATFGAPTGSPNNNQPLVIRVKDNGTARALAWNSAYRAIGVVLPSTTILGKTLYVGGFWNSADSKLDVVAVQQEF